MDNECELCGTYDHTGTWHGLCFECVGKLRKLMNARLLITTMAALDFAECDDSLQIKLGGDGDNGEHMIYLLNKIIGGPSQT